MIDFFSLKKDTSTYFLPFYIVEEASYQSLISVHCNIHSVKIWVIEKVNIIFLKTNMNEYLKAEVAEELETLSQSLTK